MAYESTNKCVVYLIDIYTITILKKIFDEYACATKISNLSSSLLRYRYHIVNELGFNQIIAALNQKNISFKPHLAQEGNVVFSSMKGLNVKITKNGRIKIENFDHVERKDYCLPDIKAFIWHYPEEGLIIALYSSPGSAYSMLFLPLIGRKNNNRNRKKRKKLKEKKKRKKNLDATHMSSEEKH